MLRRTMLGSAALVAAMLLCLGGTAAASSSIGASPTSASSSARPTFTTSSGTVQCDITLNSTVNSRISKAPGSTIGSLTSMATAACSDSLAFVDVTSMTLLAPVVKRFIFFSGSLPNSISGFGFRWDALAIRWNLSSGSSCLYTGDVSYTASDAGGAPNSITRRAVAQATFTLLVGGFACPTTMTMGALNWPVTPRITITLH